MSSNEEPTVACPQISNLLKSTGGSMEATKRNKLVFFEGRTDNFDLEDFLRASTKVLGKRKRGKRLKDVVVTKKEFETQMESFEKIKHVNVVRSELFTSLKMKNYLFMIISPPKVCWPTFTMERWEASIQDYKVLISEIAKNEAGRAMFEAQLQLIKQQGEDVKDLKFGSNLVSISSYMSVLGILLLLLNNKKVPI